MGWGRITGLLAAGVVGAGTVSMLLAGPASATTVAASLSSSGGVQSSSASNGGTVLTIDAGDSVTFRASSALVAPWVKLNSSSFPGGSSTVMIAPSKSVTYFFPSAGTYSFSWIQEVTSVGPPIGRTQSATLIVNAPPPPTSSLPGGPSGSVSGSPSAPGSSSSSTPGGTGSNPASPAGASGHPLPSFGAPHDRGRATTAGASPGIPVPVDSNGNVTFPTQGSPSPSVTTTQIVQAVPVSKTTANRPTAVAVLAIVAFAAVAGWFVYQFMTDSALRGTFRR